MRRIYDWAVARLATPITLRRYAAVLSIFTLLYHLPLMKLVLECVDSDFNGVVLTLSVVLLMAVVNFMVYYLLVYLCRWVGKAIIARRLFVIPWRSISSTPMRCCSHAI